MSAQLSAPQELTIYQAGVWGKQLQDAVGADGSVVIDCSQTSEIDGAGLQLLLIAAQNASRLGGAVSLNGLASPVERVLLEFGVFERFVIEPGELP